MRDQQLLRELERRRVTVCRLRPNRALRSLVDAHEFLAERGMLTRMPDTALPSLFGACHEAPSRAGGRGFDLWPKSKWIWSFQLGQKSGVVLTKLHQGKSLYLSSATAKVFDPLVRRAIDAAAGDEKKLLGHLAEHGPSNAEDIELEIGWDRKRLKSVRNRLERVGAIISDGLVFENPSEWYFAPMRRWDQVVPLSPARADPHLELVMAGVRAAVIAPESEVASWFSFRIPARTIDELVAMGRLVRAAQGLIALPAGSA